MNTSDKSTNNSEHYQEQLKWLIGVRNETADILAWIEEEGLAPEEEEEEE